jgi:hypothetical protein
MKYSCGFVGLMQGLDKKHGGHLGVRQKLLTSRTMIV